MGSETLPSACYKLVDESSIPFYSTSNGYNNKEKEAIMSTYHDEPLQGGHTGITKTFA